MGVSKKIAGLALAGVAALGLASAANATTTYMDTFSSAAGGGVLSASTIDVGSNFTHAYTLVLATSGKLTGGLISTANAFHGSGDFDFGTATLSGPSGTSQLQISQFMDIGQGPLADSAYFWAPVLSAGTYTLTVTGTSYSADSGFGGYITFAAAPVPEAATWAMMVGGFGLMGASMRRRQTKVTFA